MIDDISKFLPRWLYALLRPVYHRLKCLRSPYPQQQNDRLRGRDWNLDIKVPDSVKMQYLQSALSGTVDFNTENSYINVLLCAQPKSASLYIVQLLSLCLGFKNHQIGFDQAGGAIYYPRLLASKFSGQHTISHCHAEAMHHVIKMIETLKLRPIVLTRNLLDSLLSRRDMLIRDKTAANLLSSNAMQAFLNGTHEYQMDVIIDLFASQYLNFYSGWQQYRNHHVINPVFISFQELIDDEVRLVQRVATELNVTVSAQTIRDVSSQISEAGGINFFSGRSGRGKEAFTELQLDVLQNKALIIGCHDKDFLGFSDD